MLAVIATRRSLLYFEGSVWVMTNKFVQQWAAPSFVLLMIVILQLFASDLSPLLEFDRTAIYQGEWWRLVTGHFMHSNGWHLLMNFAALLVILAVQGMHQTLTRFLVLLLAGCSMIGLMLLFLSPSMMIYVGLSGWLHALLVFGACADIVKHWSSGWLILIGVFCKVIWEQTQGASADMVSLIEANVAIDAHLFGALTGLVLFFIMQSIPVLHIDKGLKAS